MKLGEVIERARGLAEAGDFEQAEVLLTQNIELVFVERDLDVVAAFAAECQQWGSQECQEQALRAAVRRESRLSELLPLLDLLQQRLNTLHGVERQEVARDCIALGSDAISLVSGPDEGMHANLRYNRGLRQLDLARDGASERLDLAAVDINAFLVWARASASMPGHMRRDNVVALAETDLGEVRLLQGRADEAAALLQNAIEILEAGKVAAWLIKRSYDLLERAWALEGSTAPRVASPDSNIEPSADDTR